MAKKRTSSRPPNPDTGALQVAIERSRSLLSQKDFEALSEELQKPLRQAFRINSLKVDKLSAIEKWRMLYNWDLEAVPFCDTGWWVNTSTGSVSKTIEHQLGQYYLQDAASMLPVELFELHSKDTPLILDMAASPGGKTTHLVSKTGDQGLVIANDSSQSRLTALRLVLQTWGAINVCSTNFPGEKFGIWFPEIFDRVLIDAPCSMESLRSTESHPMRPITDRERLSLADRQVRLLESAFLSLKVGGQVVYSTCTLAPEEDEMVLDHFLKRYGHLAQIECAQKVLPAPAPGLAQFNNRLFNPSVQNSIRLWPHICGTSGFFAALIRKNETISCVNQSAPQRSFNKTGYVLLTRHDMVRLTAVFQDVYGFDLASEIENLGFCLMRRGNIVQAVPDVYLRCFSGLPYHSLGLPVGEESPGGGFIPSHEWITRFDRKMSASRLVLDDDLLPAWMGGRDVPLTEKCSTGNVVIVEDRNGRLLGRGKVQLNKLKNLLPRRIVFSF